MVRKISIKGEHSMVRSQGAFEQAGLFGTKPPEKKPVKRFLQLIKDAAKTRKITGHVVQREHTSVKRRIPASYSSAMTLAHLLYPKNFPKIIATGTKLAKELHSQITYTQYSPLTRQSQLGINSFYYWRSGAGDAYHKHKTQNKKAIQAAYKEIKQSGIFANKKAMNVGISKSDAKTPVFFEVTGIYLPRLKVTIQNLPANNEEQRRTKRQAQLLLKFLEKQPNVSGLLHTHTT